MECLAVVQKITFHPLLNGCWGRSDFLSVAYGPVVTGAGQVGRTDKAGACSLRNSTTDQLILPVTSGHFFPDRCSDIQSKHTLEPA